MQQQDQPARHGNGLFLSPLGQRRVQFQAVCAEQFDRLFVADGVEQAQVILSQQRVDLLVIDLEHFDRSFDALALGQLIAARAGGATLALCPFENAGWLPELMGSGPLAYVMAPLTDDGLKQSLQVQRSGEDDAARLRSLLDTGARLQQAIAELEELEQMAERVCLALGTLPGVVHASLFCTKEVGDLHLEAQHGTTGVDLARMLNGTDRLMQSPLRHAFPALLAATSGEMSLCDSPGKCGDAELALALAEGGIGMVLGVPLPASRAGVHRGSICLMFEQPRQFSAAEFTAFAGFAALAGLGLRMADISRHNEQLAGRLTHLSTTDALTGLVNRRHGEYLLELEVRRARRYKVPLALLVFDIDGFKAINDQFGHPVGDVAIRSVAEAAQSAVRNSDVLVRSGGEEFQIIAPHTSATDALKIAEKIRLAIAATDIPGCDNVTVSLGVGQALEEETPDALAVRVDAALARAKRAGRNCVELARG
jgi:diguanylate cyclase (GGDEF)-like protein